MVNVSASSKAKSEAHGVMMMKMIKRRQGQHRLFTMSSAYRMHKNSVFHGTVDCQLFCNGKVTTIF